MVLLIKNNPYQSIIEFEQDAEEEMFILVDIYNKGIVTKYRSNDLESEYLEKF